MNNDPTYLITHSILVPDLREWRFAGIGFVEQIPCAKTHKRGARDDRICVHNVSRPECLRHNHSLLFNIVTRDLVKVSADNHVCSLIEAARHEVRETLPIAKGKLFKGDNRHDGIRVGRDKADEAFEVELWFESQA